MSSNPIDWSQLWYPGRRQPFTPDEMARAGADGPSRTLLALLLVNVLMLLLAVALVAPEGQELSLAGAIAVLTLLGAPLGWWLWWRPWRQPLMLASLGVVAGMVLAALLLRQLVPDREGRGGPALVFGAGGGTLGIAGKPVGSPGLALQCAHSFGNLYKTCLAAPSSGN
jgi:hypothetical protein